ncbi:hypothetical protein D3C86_1555370 [compost metagenome]
MEEHNLTSGITRMKAMARVIRMGLFTHFWISLLMVNMKNCLKKRKIVTNFGNVLKMLLKNGRQNGRIISTNIMVMRMVLNREIRDLRFL